MPKKKRKGPSKLERKFFNTWAEAYPTCLPVKEYRFHHRRMFRFDFAWPKKYVAVEIQGMGPGHCSLSGMTQDHEKHMEALLLGWKVVYFTTLGISDTHRPENYDKLAQLLGLEYRASSSTYIPLSKR